MLLCCFPAVYAEVTITGDCYARFVSLNVNDGLCGSKILDIKQDSAGFIWLATSNGLSRYDGCRFLNYRHSPEDSLSISGNYVQALAIDKEGALWVGTKNGLNKYDNKTGTFQTWESGISFPGNQYIRKIMPDDNSILWVETVSGVLNKINTKTCRVSCFHHHEVTQDYYSYHCLFKDSDGDIWVGNRGRGPYIFDTAKETMRLIEHDPGRIDKKRDPEVAYVFEDSQHRFWVGAIDGFWRFYKETETFKRVIPMSSFHIIEDSDGFLWLSGGKGLYRFNVNTNSAVLYSNNESNPYSLTNNSINVLFEDKDGNIWIGTDDGVSIFSKSNDYAKYVRRLTDTGNALVSSNITSVLEDKDGNIWFGTKKRGLSKWNPREDKYTNYRHNGNDKNSLASDRVSCLYQDKEYNIWIGLWQGVGFNKYDKKSDSFIKYAYDSNSLKKDWYNAFIEDGRGRFLTGLWGANGIHIFDREKCQFLPYNFRNTETPANQRLVDIAIDGQDIWTGFGNYVYKYKIPTNSFLSYTGNPGEGQSLRGEKNTFPFFARFNCTEYVGGKVYIGTSNGLIIFNEGGPEYVLTAEGINIYAISGKNTDSQIWLGTEKGLAVLNKFGKIEIISGNDTPGKVLYGKEITSVSETDGKVFIGTKQGLYIYNKTKGTFLPLPFSVKETLECHINSVVGTPDAIYLATNNSLLEINMQSATPTVDTLMLGLAINDVMPNVNGDTVLAGTNNGIYQICNGSIKLIDITDRLKIYSLANDGEKTIWAGTDKGLVSILEGYKKVTFFDQPGKHGTTSHLISFLANDSEGYIWAGTTNKGLNRIDCKTLEVEHFYCNSRGKGNYCETAANVFFQQNNGTIWIGGNCLHRFNPITNSFEKISWGEDNPYKAIKAIQEDDKGNLWLGTGDGLVFYNPAKGEFWENNFVPEIPNIDYSGCAIKLSSGELLFAGKTGAVIFKPKLIDCFGGNDGKITITGIIITGDNSVYNINGDTRVELNHTQNFFTIEFSPMLFPCPKNSCLYKLEGINDKWVKSDKNSAGYTNIPPGEYIFRIKQNPESKTESRITLVISPPFWGTWWFVLIIIAFFSGIIIYWLITLTKKQKTEKQKIILEHKLLQLQMNPHFIFNVLSAIQGFIYRKDTSESGLYLSRFAKLMRIFLQNSRNEWITLSKEIEALQYYLTLQQLRVETKFEFMLDYDNIPDTDYVLIPPMIIQPFVENAIEHGIANIAGKGKIEILFTEKGNCLETVIRDNGKGYYPGERKTTHKSMAIEIIRKRIEIMDTTDCRTELIVGNRKDKESTGTEVMIKFPYKKEF